MSTQFKFYRYVVNPTAQTVLFPSGKSKKAIVLSALKSEQVKDFESKKSVLGLVVMLEDGDFVHCLFGKQSQTARSRSPKEKFMEERLENWPHCHMFIDLGDHPDGQKIAIEHKAGVFSDEVHPLRALADQMNGQLKREGFEMSINPITKEPSFWALVDQHPKDIEELTFRYRVPNLFKIGNKLEDELKDVEREYGANETAITFKNKSGGLVIPKDERLIQESVEYIAKGAGEYKLRIKGKTYTNNDDVASKTIDVTLDTNDGQVIKDIMRDLLK